MRKAPFGMLVVVALVSGALPKSYSQQSNNLKSLPRQFEVVSIKPRRNPGPPNAIDLTFLRQVAKSNRDGRFGMENVPLTLLFELAYDANATQVIGWPSWAESERYDIAAKADYAATFEEMRPMLKSLLADRFNLQVHQQSQTMPLYELIVASGAHKLHTAGCVTRDPNSPPPPVRFPPPPLSDCGGIRRMTMGGSSERTERIEAKGISMPQLVRILSDELSRPVIDKTGYTGAIDMHLEFTPTDAITSGSGAGLSLFSALSRELGLRLVPGKGRVEVFVIDRAERATQN